MAAASLVAASAWGAKGALAATTTTTTTTVTTTTTPAGGMFSAVDGGLAALTAQVDALGSNVRAKGLLQRQLLHMQMSRTQAETLLNKGRRREATVWLRNADTWMKVFLNRVRTSSVKRSLGQATQASLVATVTQMRSDLRTVRLATK